MKYEIKVFSNISDGDDNELFPVPLRSILIGSSGCGKTTLLGNIIYERWVPYKYLYIFSKSREQSFYKNLENDFRIIERETGEDILTLADTIIPIDECNEKSLVVFDDFMLESQSLIKDYFVRGRHKNISCIYLAQCFTKVDIQTIRSNANFIVVFKQMKHYADMIYNDYLASTMPKRAYDDACRQCWSNTYGFMTIKLGPKCHVFQNFTKRLV